jgi:hypothetical protein
MQYMQVEGDKVALIKDDCVICLEGYEEDKDAAKLPCGHYFHSACIIAWIDQGKETCPLCKAKINDGKPSG